MFLRSRAPVSLGRGDNQFCHKRVYCHEALHLKEKLQSAGSKQKTVGWDTDEASDASLPRPRPTWLCTVYPRPRHVSTVWRAEVNTRIHVRIQLQSKYVEYVLPM